MLELNLSYWEGVPLCITCRVEFPRPGMSTCQKCGTRNKLRLQNKKLRGICYTCPKPADDGLTYCRECLDKRKEDYVSLPEGVCTTCKKRDSREGASTCQICFDKRKANEKEKHAKGLCKRCSGPISKERRKHRFTLCGKCATTENARVRKAREYYIIRGKCHKHPNRPVGKDKTRCEECSADKVVYNHKRVSGLKEKGLCVWCGKKPNNGRSMYCDEHWEKSKASRKRQHRLKELRESLGRKDSPDEHEEVGATDHEPTEEEVR